MAQKFVSVNYDMNSYLPEALSYKEKLGEIDGVTDVTWLDDAVTEKQVQILKKTSSIPRLLIRKHEQVQ